MLFAAAAFAAFKEFINRKSRPVFRRKLYRKLVTFALVFNLLLWPGQASTIQSISQLSSSIGHSVTVLSTGPARISAAFIRLLVGSSGQSERADTLADRVAAVARIQVSPVKYVGYEGETITLTAMPLDALSRAVQGAKFTWESSNTDKLRVDDVGRASLLQPGLARVTCRAGSASATALVLVRPGRRRAQTDEQWRADQASLHADGTTQGASGSGVSGMVSFIAQSLAPTTYAQGGPPVTDVAYDELWTDPANLVGSPLNRVAEATRLGTVLPEGSNFNLAIPLVSRAGRGMNLDLTLYYNSRLWSQHGSAVTFDALTSWPGPGFSLGFGRIVTYLQGSAYKYLLVDPDGTRHYLQQISLSSDVYETTDGTHITYWGGVSGGTLYYNNGTRIGYSSINNRLLPAGIYDTNGNYIQIAYKPTVDEYGVATVYAPAAIDYVTDTLGRIIRFNYDAGGKLTSITAPGWGGTVQNPVTQMIAQFDYQTVAVNGSFSGLTVENRPSSMQGLRHVYLPNSGGRGYLFTYSAFGMIYSYSVRKDMQFSGSPTPTIQDGTESANVTFNYPTASTPAITGPPRFTQRTETALNSPAGTFTYATNTDDAINQTRTFVITRPDSSTLLLTRSIDGTIAAGGLLVQSETRNSGGTSFAKSILVLCAGWRGVAASAVCHYIGRCDSCQPSESRL